MGDAVAFWSVHGVGFLGRHSSFTVPPHAPPPPLPGVQRGAGKLSGQIEEVRKIPHCDGLASYLT